MGNTRDGDPKWFIGFASLHNQIITSLFLLTSPFSSPGNGLGIVAFTLPWDWLGGLEIMSLRGITASERETGRTGAQLPHLLLWAEMWCLPAGREPASSLAGPV